MRAEEIRPYITKFVTIILDDDTEVSGYIANPEDFKQSSDDISIVLVNGLQNSQIPIFRIVGIHEAVREETIEIPIVGDSSSIISKKKQKEEQQQDFNDRLDELFDKSLSETLEVTLPNGKVIDNSENHS